MRTARPLNGSFSVTTRIGYTYDIVASAGITVPSSWARFSGIPLSVNGWRTQITLYQETTTQITRQDQRGLGFGGWSLDVLALVRSERTCAQSWRWHAARSRSAHRERCQHDRRRRHRRPSEETALRRSSRAYRHLRALPSVRTAACTSSTTPPSRHRVDANGIQTTVAGTGVRGFSGDGGPANQRTAGEPDVGRVGPGRQRIHRGSIQFPRPPRRAERHHLDVRRHRGHGRAGRRQPGQRDTDFSAQCGGWP